MPWQEESPMSQRKHFFNLWKSNSHKVTELCKLFGISRKTGYKWIKRGLEQRENTFEDQSKRPSHSPIKTREEMEVLIVNLRKKYPDWGGRKLKRLLTTQDEKDIPAASTITQILKRNGLLDTTIIHSKKRIRFEHEYPNSLWQMDFKGHFAMTQGRCHPLTVLDDHSRFNIVLKACRVETRKVVKHALIEAFEHYGLPERMTMDNGSPWGNKLYGRYTKLTVWLLDLGIKVSHSRPYNPQTQGKDERFHRTLKAEVLTRRHFINLNECQKVFNDWRELYNYVRPHDALKLDVPASRYKISNRHYKDCPTEYEYSEDLIKRKVNKSGAISYRSQKCFLGEAFAGSWVAIQRTIEPNKYEVFYRHQRIAKINYGG